MSAKDKSAAMAVISQLDLSSYSARAISNGTLDSADQKLAEDEYCQFLLLIWVNTIMNGQEMIVPTERADAIWHEHILHTGEYRAFCLALIGDYIDHNPGLTKGSTAHSSAMKHTNQMNKDHGDGGFYLAYMVGGCGGSNAKATEVDSATGSWSDGGHSSSSSDSSSSSSCGGSSCGGGGCGGGCGG